MKLTPFRAIFLKAVELSNFQKSIQDYTRQLTSNVFLSGVLIDYTTITTSGTSLKHGLGSDINGYFIVSKLGNANIWKLSSNDNELVLAASSNVSAKVWVF